MDMQLCTASPTNHSFFPQASIIGGVKSACMEADISTPNERFLISLKGIWTTSFDFHPAQSQRRKLLFLVDHSELTLWNSHSALLSGWRSGFTTALRLWLGLSTIADACRKLCEREEGRKWRNREIPNKDREKAEMSYSPSHFTFSPSVGI